MQRYRIIVEFRVRVRVRVRVASSSSSSSSSSSCEFEFELRVRDGDHLALRCTSKAGVSFFEEQTVVAMSVLGNKL